MLIGPRRNVGRPADYPRRYTYADKYGLTWAQMRKLHKCQLDQLDACLSEEARRLLLGKGEQ